MTDDANVWVQQCVTLTIWHELAYSAISGRLSLRGDAVVSCLRSAGTTIPILYLTLFWPVLGTTCCLQFDSENGSVFYFKIHKNQDKFFLNLQQGTSLFVPRYNRSLLRLLYCGDYSIIDDSQISDDVFDVPFQSRSRATSGRCTWFVSRPTASCTRVGARTGRCDCGR